MCDVIYRIQEISPADTGYGAFIVNIIPASQKAINEKLEVGDYIVVHKDNGPSEEKE